MFVDTSQSIPIRIWTDTQDEFYNDPEVMKQTYNLANHPLAVKAVCLMPDFHAGYGMPIGGVLATKSGVIPYAVGVDIGCGMIACQTKFSASQFSREDLEKIRLDIHQRVPCGDAKNRQGIVQNAYTKELEDHLDVHLLKDLWWNGKPQSQIGTLGGGNHFIELQKDDEDHFWIMIHSGSRGTGKLVCDYFHKIARQYMEQFHSRIPTTELSFLPREVPEFDEYWKAMHWCMRYAELNRDMMFDAVVEAIEQQMQVKFESVYKFDTHHNFAAIEHHGGDNLIIHRKGSVRARGMVTIPGSMGTASYIGKGTEYELSFSTCSHGAGRRLARKKATAAVTYEQATDMMKHVVFNTREGWYDEHPHAYKDIEDVMKNQDDLVKPITRLEPLAVVKG